MHVYVPCYKEAFYLKSKAVRLGQIQLTEADKEPLNLIKQRFGVTAYYFDFKKEDNKVRVDLMFDSMADGPRVGYSNQELVTLFRTFLTSNPERFTLTDSTELVVFFETFERVATEEMLDEVKENEIREMQQLFKSIAQIHNAARSFTIFYHTNAQLESAKTDGTNRAVCDHMNQALKKYDIFDYCKPDTISIHFESIETIDKDYNGKWTDYYR